MNNKPKWKAHALWVEPDYVQQQGFVMMWSYDHGPYAKCKTVKAFVITADQLPAITERMARAMKKKSCVDETWEGFARAAMRAIGLVAKKGKL